MRAAVRLREDFSPDELRALARRSRDVSQSWRLLALAAVRNGDDRTEAAKAGGMDRQTLRDWVHRFNANGPEGLFDHWTDGLKPRLSAEQLAELAGIVDAEPDREPGRCRAPASADSCVSPLALGFTLEFVDANYSFVGVS
jgi:transposase